MLSLGVYSAIAQMSNPLDVSCGSVKTYFKEAACCGNSDKSLGLPDVCPSLDVQISYPTKTGIYSPCPPEEVYYKFTDTNPSAPGYDGCVSEDKMTPCGWCAALAPLAQNVPPPARGALALEALLRTAIQNAPPPARSALVHTALPSNHF